jgi:hypothetical protein
LSRNSRRFRKFGLNGDVHIVADGWIPRRQSELRAAEMSIG